MLHSVLSFRMPISAEDRIRALAREHAVEPVRLEIDDYADAISRLSDADVPQDEIADLIVALQRHGVVDADLAAELYGDYLSQTTQ